MSIETVVLGGAGYVGGELLRLVSAHPELKLAAAVSSTYAGKPIEAVFPHLAPACGDRSFSAPDDWSDRVEDGTKLAVFSAAPHGASAPMIADAINKALEFGAEVHVVDSSADFRFDDTAQFEAIYGQEHPQPGLAEDFHCSVPEHADEISVPHAGHPGCFATATLLAAVPLVAAGIVDDNLFVTGITGSTGSGRTAKVGTHHPERNSNLYAYKPLSHRHAPEVEALITKATGATAGVHFVPHSGPFARGIHITLQASLTDDVDIAQVGDIFRAAYEPGPFVRFVDGTPRVKNVVASNYAHIGAAVGNDTVTVMCVIDNLVKGAAGGAMQWMNRLWGLPEASGLTNVAPAWT